MQQPAGRRDGSALTALAVVAGALSLAGRLAGDTALSLGWSLS